MCLCKDCYSTISVGRGSRQQAPWRSGCWRRADTSLTTPTDFWERSELCGSTYNTPTIITWIGPWRNLILCGNTRSLRAEAHFHILDLRDARGSHLHEFELFHSLHDDGEDDWREKRVKRGRGSPAERHLFIYSLIPGAAMVILEMTTWEMPLTAAFFGTQIQQRSHFKHLALQSRPGLEGRAETLTVEWPSLLPFSSVTAMPFRISL